MLALTIAKNQDGSQTMIMNGNDVSQEIESIQFNMKDGTTTSVFQTSQPTEFRKAMKPPYVWTGGKNVPSFPPTDPDVVVYPSYTGIIHRANDSQKEWKSGREVFCDAGNQAVVPSHKVPVGNIRPCAQCWSEYVTLGDKEVKITKMGMRDYWSVVRGEMRTEDVVK